MELKYKSTDVMNMIDSFVYIAENKNNPDAVAKEMMKLTVYPANVVQQFMKCMERLVDKSDNYIKENYNGIVAYITMRLNFC